VRARADEVDRITIPFAALRGSALRSKPTPHTLRFMRTREQTGNHYVMVLDLLLLVRQARLELWPLPLAMHQDLLAASSQRRQTTQTN
jgi:hypothetical protein